MSQMKSDKQQGFFGTVKEIVFLFLIVFLIRTFGFGLYQVPSGSMETTMLVGERFFADKFTYLFSKPKIGDIIAFNDPLFNYSKNPFMRLFQEYVWGPSNWTKRVIAIPGDHVVGKIEEGMAVIYRNKQKIDQPFVNKYPLIMLWKEDPVVIRDIIERKTTDMVLQGRLAGNYRAAYVERLLEHYLMWRSYDDSYSFEEQPFYHMNPAYILRDENNNVILKKPSTPLSDDSVEQDVMKNPGSLSNKWNGTDVFDVTLGANEYWLMGDNRLASKDSRFLGPIDGRLIHGKILFRVWSNDSYESWWIIDLLKHPIDFWSRMRWHRFFNWLN